MLDSVLFPSCSSPHVSEFVSDTTHALCLQNAMKSTLVVLVEINWREYGQYGVSLKQVCREHFICTTQIFFLVKFTFMANHLQIYGCVCVCVCACVRACVPSQICCHRALLQWPREALHTHCKNLPGTQRKHFMLLPGYVFTGLKPLASIFSA